MQKSYYDIEEEEKKKININKKGNSLRIKRATFR